MATTGRRLEMKFGTLTGTKTFSVKNIKEGAAAADVKTLMQAMITNGSIYTYPPLTAESATIIETVETDVDLS